MAEQLEDDAQVLAALVQWLVFEASPTATTVELLHGFAQRLCRAGFDLIRVNLQTRPLSPQAASVDYVWRPGERGAEPLSGVDVVVREQHALDGGGVQVTALGHGSFQSEVFRTSPFFPVIVGGELELRRRLEPSQAAFDFPILKDLAKQGASDYLTLPVQFYGGAASAISFATRKPGGFTDAQVAILRDARRPLVLALSPRLGAHTMGTLLGAYLGPKTAELVLAGAIERGNVQEIDAAIWFSDLRNFTPLSAGVAPPTLIAWLNDYFAAVGRAITGHDGEILKFMGDAILAVWPVSESRTREATCRAALAAALAANAELDELNRTREAAGFATLQHGIGLHVGRAQYGNIGAEGRLDFTVIGPAVNTTSRLEGLCAKLSHRVITSAEFARCAESGLASLGSAELKGVSGSQEVFGIGE
jgi:adenylate cyclase